MGADENLDLSLANASCIDKDQMIFSHLTKIPDEMQKKKPDKSQKLLKIFTRARCWPVRNGLYLCRVHANPYH